MAHTSELTDYKTYVFSYNHDGAAWTLEVQAVSEADARIKVANMANANLDGELIAKIPATYGLLPRILVAIRNALTRRTAM